jgi:hypothetical protein
MVVDALDIALLVARALDVVGTPYFLGGSLASSLQGEPRATNDIDFVVDLPLGKVDDLAAALGEDFAVDRDSIRDAIRLRACANVFYLPLVTKIDLFILNTGPFDASEFKRRRPIRVRGDELIVMKSPEDSILRKLLWFVEGGEQSEKQWRDVVEVLRVSGPIVDGPYLDEWASRLGLVALLERARTSARGP